MGKGVGAWSSPGVQVQCGVGNGALEDPNKHPSKRWVGMCAVTRQELPQRDFSLSPMPGCSALIVRPHAAVQCPSYSSGRCACYVRADLHTSRPSCTAEAQSVEEGNRLG